MQVRLQWLATIMIAQLIGAGSVLAQSKVGIININAAIANTKDGQKSIQELETRFAPRKKDLEKKQQAISALQAQLQKGGTVLGDDQKRKLMADIDTQTKSYNRDLEDASQELEQEQQKIFQELGGKMMSVIDKYAKEKSYTLILDVSSQQTPVLYAANEVDITKDIIEAYDKSSGAPAPAPAPAKPAPASPATKK